MTIEDVQNIVNHHMPNSDRATGVASMIYNNMKQFAYSEVKKIAETDWTNINLIDDNQLDPATTKISEHALAQLLRRIRKKDFLSITNKMRMEINQGQQIYPKPEWEIRFKCINKEKPTTYIKFQGTVYVVRENEVVTVMTWQKVAPQFGYVKPKSFKI